jgi:tetratricopeptide (TPR) repeat protein
MASTSAPTGPFRGSAGGTTPPLRHLWQVPTFLLGLLALAAVSAARPLWHDVPRCCEDPALAALRDSLKRPEFDGDHALKLGAEAVQGARTPAAAAEAHFLLGSVYVALAERADSTRASDLWREARSHLEQASALSVPEEDRPRLDYRLAKAWAHTGEAPPKVIAALEQSLEEGADGPHDKARGYGLLAEAYLKLPQPDLEKALDATVKEIDLPNVDDELLAPARLRRGELLLRLDRAEEGRDMLRHLGTKAPPGLVARARRLLVRSLEQDSLWGEAAGVWRDILDDSSAPPQDRQAVLYHLGLCLRNDGAHKDEAREAWKKCLALGGTGDEGPAAALRVAELCLRTGQAKDAVAAFERAVGDVKEPGGWHNALVPLPQGREAFEAGCKAARTAGDFEASARVAQLYERLAPAGRAQELRAETLDVWARATQDKARLAAGDRARELYGEAEALLRQAGEAYEQSAKAQVDPAEQAERLWPAANDFFEGRDAVRAAAAFDRFIQIAWPEHQQPLPRFLARLNEACYKLALARRDAGLGGVRETLENAVNHLGCNSRYFYRARYELALTMKKPDGSWTDEAQACLEQNLNQLRTETADLRDAEAREKTLYALGDLYFDRKEQRGVISRAIETLEEALQQFPNNSAALSARYELAESYRLRADQLNRTLSPEQLTSEAKLIIMQKIKDDHERALANYGELSRTLEAKTERARDEELLLVYAQSKVAEVQFLLGAYARSGELYDALAERLKDKPGLEFDHACALAGVARAYSMVMTATPAIESDYEVRMQAARQKVQRALRDIRAGLAKLEPEARREFEEYLRVVEKAPR